MGGWRFEARLRSVASEMTVIKFNDPVCAPCIVTFNVSVFRPVTMSVCILCGSPGVLCRPADKAQEIDYRPIVSQETPRQTSLNCLCLVCGRRYMEHPFDNRPEACDAAGKPFIHRLCDGGLVYA